MGKNKGKGAANLRRINSITKKVKHWDKVYKKNKEAGLSVNFDLVPTEIFTGKQND